MAEFFDALTQEHIEFIGKQHMFFVGTAADEGRVNVSPKGMDSFRVLNNSQVVWLNLTGSGNETAAHILDNNRMTVMFCSFDKQPLILRLYGKSSMVYPRDERKFQEYASLFNHQPGTRQFFEMQVESVQTSCGFAVPRYELQSERDTLKKWAEGKGDDGIREYWENRNQVSIDGRPTEIIR